jgi:hypothetical protein
MKGIFDIDALLNNEDEQLNEVQTTSFAGRSSSIQDEIDMDREENENSSVETMDDDRQSHQSTTKASNKVNYLNIKMFID